jgi:hypothetical protein
MALMVCEIGAMAVRLTGDKRFGYLKEAMALASSS